MNDVEELLREELRARVDAAEASHPDEPPVTLLGGLDRRIRRSRLRRRWSGAALSAVTVAVAITLPLALMSSGVPSRVRPVTPGRGVPLTDTAATPGGWATVAFGDAQISVPQDWLISTTPMCGRAAPDGYVLLVKASTSVVGQYPGCRQPPNTAAIFLEPGNKKRSGGFGTSINGIAVVPIFMGGPAGSVSYYVPTLHVVVTATGPLANRVLATLTRSPLSVVLANGPRFPVPSSWRWHEFRGIKFATPGGWALVRNGQYACPFGLSAKAVILVGANSKMPRCGGEFGTAGLFAARFGVTAMAGPSASQGASVLGHCGRAHGLRYCYSTPIQGGGQLDVAVSVPGRQRTTLVRIGLAGDGAAARTIFESIRPGRG